MKNAAPLIALSLVLSCGGGGAERNGSTSGAEEPVDTPTADLSDPAVLGERVAADYAAVIGDVVALCEPRPSVEELKPLVDALFERYAGIFVGYGRYYQSMDAAGRAVVDSRMTNAFLAMGGETFERFSQAVTHYSELDTDLGDRLRAFNIITQYYNYDLLREQEPEEAARLGL